MKTPSRLDVTLHFDSNPNSPVPWTTLGMRVSLAALLHGAGPFLKEKVMYSGSMKVFKAIQKPSTHVHHFIP